MLPAKKNLASFRQFWFSNYAIQTNKDVPCRVSNQINLELENNIQSNSNFIIYKYRQYVVQFCECTMSNQITDNEILKLWKNPLFSGSFRGVKTFQTCLKLEKDIDISERRLYNILKKEPIFLIHQNSPKTLTRRHLNLNNYGELVFGDIGKLKKPITLLSWHEPSTHLYSVSTRIGLVFELFVCRSLCFMFVCLLF